MTSMLSQFKKIDKLIDRFTRDFKFNIQPLVYKHHPEINNEEDLEKLIQNYAMETFEFADSVINKDNNYNEDRIKEEYESMNSLISRIKEDYFESEFLQEVHKKAKRLIVDYFPNTMELSSFGFLIMERYTQLNLYSFGSSLNKIINEQDN